jgi:two-component system sensor histidine kinase HydH
MSDDWDDDAPSRPRRSRRGRQNRGMSKRRPRTPEERAYRDARRRANARLSFYSHLLAYGAVFVLVLFVAGFRPAFIMALAWGIGLVFHFFAALVAPDLRQRLIRREVSREVANSVPRERRSIEDKHARSLEQLSASIAHEIRNPITAAKSLVQQMGEDPNADESIEYANVALEELDRVEKSISHLLRFAREEEMDMRDTNLNDVFDSALETFRDRLERSGIEVKRDLGTAGALYGDSEKLRRVVINLIGNAFDALEQSGTRDPSIVVDAGDNLAGTEVWIRIRDNGPGISPDVVNKIFSPFYTNKANGTGLGLAISKKVVDAHGGSIEVNSADTGTEFLITLPKRSASVDEPSQAS